MIVRVVDWDWCNGWGGEGKRYFEGVPAFYIVNCYKTIYLKKIAYCVKWGWAFEALQKLILRSKIAYKLSGSQLKTLSFQLSIFYVDYKNFQMNWHQRSTTKLYDVLTVYSI